MDLTVVESRELVMGCGKDQGERKLEREREQDYNKNVCACVCVREPSGMARLHRVEIKTVFRKILSTGGQQ